jgi:hypothetical protein
MSAAGMVAAGLIAGAAAMSTRVLVRSAAATPADASDPGGTDRLTRPAHAVLAIPRVAFVELAGAERELERELLAGQAGEHELGGMGRVLGIVAQQRPAVCDLFVVKDGRVKHTCVSGFGVANAVAGRFG